MEDLSTKVESFDETLFNKDTQTDTSGIEIILSSLVAIITLIRDILSNIDNDLDDISMDTDFTALLNKLDELFTHDIAGETKTISYLWLAVLNGLNIYPGD